MEEKKKKKTRGWADLPVDLLIEILGNLMLLDHLSFQGVCKAWRFASLRSPPENQPTAQPHWLIFSKKSKTSPTTWELGDSSTRRLYSIDLPELTGPSNYISTHGWLLLFHFCPGFIFFFNPFSRARIDLPWINEFPNHGINRDNKPAFALSAPPTSPDCTVFAVSYVDQDTFQIATCRRGEDAWTIAGQFKRRNRKFYSIKRAVFSGGKLYWVDKRGIIRQFRPQKGTWLSFWRPREVSYMYRRWESFYSYLMEWNGKVTLCFCFRRSGKRHHFVLKTGLMKLLGKEDKRYFVENKGKETTHMPRWLRPETFYVGAWCVSCDSEDDHGHKLFSWHMRCDSCTPCDNNCDFDSEKKSVWIEPKWINPSPTIAWTA